jgi:hypothetical protein
MPEDIIEEDLLRSIDEVDARSKFSGNVCRPY